LPGEHARTAKTVEASKDREHLFEVAAVFAVGRIVSAGPGYAL